MTVVAAPGPHLRVEIGEESRRRVDVPPAHDDAPRDSVVFLVARRLEEVGVVLPEDGAAVGGGGFVDVGVWKGPRAGQQHSPEAMSHEWVAVIDNAQQSGVSPTTTSPAGRRRR